MVRISRAKLRKKPKFLDNRKKKKPRSARNSRNVAPKIEITTLNIQLQKLHLLLQMKLYNYKFAFSGPVENEHFNTSRHQHPTP